MGRSVKHQFQVGDRFFEWEVIEIVLVPRKSGHQRNGKIYQRRMLKCRCSCGTVSLIEPHVASVLNTSKSCGHEKHQFARKYGYPAEQHTLYTMWHSMVTRCTDKNAKDFSRYGGRGILICDEWQTFFGFHESIKNIWVLGYQIDRIDNDGNYSLENCRWVSAEENVNNRRNTVFIEVTGEKIAIGLANRKYGIGLPLGTVRKRILSLDWDPMKAMQTPKRQIN